jgi:hypothetical protein
MLDTETTAARDGPREIAPILNLILAFQCTLSAGVAGIGITAAIREMYCGVG